MSFNVFIDIIVLSCRLSLFSLSLSPFAVYIVTINTHFIAIRNYSLSLSLSCARAFSLVQDDDLLFMDSLMMKRKKKSEEKCQIQTYIHTRQN